MTFKLVLKKASTSDHLFILRTLFETYCSHKEGRLYACFIDIRKAFDMFTHEGIKINLLEIDVGTNF